MGLDWNYRLTPDTFRDFCSETVSELYLKAYSATVDEKKADKLTVAALCRTFASRTELYEDESRISPEDAVIMSLKSLLGSRERARIEDDDTFSLSKERLPSESRLDALVDKAVKQAEIEMPRYAPVFSGTKGTFYILAIVLCIIVCIVLIWTGKLTGIVSGGEKAGVGERHAFSMIPADSELLVDALCNVEKNDGGCNLVKFVVSGADVGAVSKLSVYSPDGSSVSAHDCGGRYTCFAANGGEYKLVLTGNNGVSVTKFIETGDRVSAADALPACLVYVHDCQSAFDASPSDASASETTKFSIPGIVSYELVSAPEKAGTFRLSSDGEYSFTASRGFTGTDSVGIKIKYANGLDASVNVPLIVVNSAPKFTAGANISVHHSPSSKGRYIGKLTAADPDKGDAEKLSYSLVSEKACKVVLSSNGGYVVKFSDNVDGAQTAYFIFEVSDGLLGAKYKVTFDLVNGLIENKPLSKDVYCYSGENGFYDLGLPSKDIDGDALSWSVAGKTEGTTENGTEFRRGGDSSILVKLDPSKNSESIELLDLICSDGWKEMHVQYELKIHANPDPEFLTKSVTADVASNIAVCKLEYNCPCPFNRYRITDVQGVNGIVQKNVGWEDMTFTFMPDGTGAPASAIVTVQEIQSGRTVTHTVNVIQYY